MTESMKAPLPKPEQKRETIAVARLRFKQAIDFGNGLDSKDNLRAGGVASRVQTTITYVPHLRHFIVTVQPKDMAPGVIYVHESTVLSWEPLG